VFSKTSLDPWFTKGFTLDYRNIFGSNFVD